MSPCRAPSVRACAAWGEPGAPRVVSTVGGDCCRWKGTGAMGKPWPGAWPAWLPQPLPPPPPLAGVRRAETFEESCRPAPEWSGGCCRWLLWWCCCGWWWWCEGAAWRMPPALLPPGHAPLPVVACESGCARPGGWPPPVVAAVGSWWRAVGCGCRERPPKEEGAVVVALVGWLPGRDAVPDWERRRCSSYVARGKRGDTDLQAQSLRPEQLPRGVA